MCEVFCCLLCLFCPLSLIILRAICSSLTMFVSLSILQISRQTLANTPDVAPIPTNESRVYPNVMTVFALRLRYCWTSRKTI